MKHNGYLTFLIQFESIIDALRQRSQPEPVEAQHDAEARRNAVDALIRLASTYKEFLNDKIFEEIFDCLIKGCEDYAVDKRGDVGSFVRESSMKALEVLSGLGMRKQQVMVNVIFY